MNWTQKTIAIISLMISAAAHAVPLPLRINILLTRDTYNLVNFTSENSLDDIVPQMEAIGLHGLDAEAHDAHLVPQFKWAGFDIVTNNQFDPHAEIRAAAREAAAQRFTALKNIYGQPEAKAHLNDAISNYMANHMHMEVAPFLEYLANMGLPEAAKQAIQAFKNAFQDQIEIRAVHDAGHEINLFADDVGGMPTIQLIWRRAINQFAIH